MEKNLGDTLSLIRERKMKEAEEKNMETYDVAFERGEKSGEKKTQEKYGRQRQEEIARHIVSCHGKGLSIEDIASIFGLSQEEVVAILDKPSSGGQ